MEVRVDRERLFSLLDTILPLWQEKKFPYNKGDAVIPQTLIPQELRSDSRKLACFYFFVCIYMRGGIESGQAFNALLRMWREDPDLFDPLHAQWMSQTDIQQILKKYIGWDSKAASINWLENSRRLVAFWDSNPMLLIKGLRDYEEALRRMRNKRTKRELKEAGKGGAGFRGFQPKMVSMLLYFLDWEGLLEKRFLYPAPADFHNFRLGFNQGIIILSIAKERVGVPEKISKPWRDAVMAYLKFRKADPIEVADAIWLFSLVMCGNSPLTVTRSTKKSSGMFQQEDVPQALDTNIFLTPRYHGRLIETCLSCVLQDNCDRAIPAQPYYRKGLIILNERLRVEEIFKVSHKDRLAQRAAARTAQTNHPTLFADWTDG